MGADEAVKLKATVVEERPFGMYKVALPDRRYILAHAVGIRERNFVRLVPGDWVEVELTPHDPTRGRITRKMNKG